MRSIKRKTDIKKYIKYAPILLAVFVAAFSAIQIGKAQATSPEESTSIPSERAFEDAAFESCVKNASSEIDSTNGNNSTSGGANSATYEDIAYLNCSNSPVNSFRGIELLTNLVSANLKSTGALIDVSQNTKLTSLYIESTNLYDVILGNNTNFDTLYITGSSTISSINLAGVPNLSTLLINTSSMNSLDISNNTKIANLAIVGSSPTVKTAAPLAIVSTRPGTISYAYVDFRASTGGTPFMTQCTPRTTSNAWSFETTGPSLNIIDFTKSIDTITFRCRFNGLYRPPQSTSGGGMGTTYNDGNTASDLKITIGYKGTEQNPEPDPEPTYTDYTINYDDNGGSGGPGTQSFKAIGSAGSFPLSSTVPSRAGYTFIAWQVVNSTTAYQPGQNVTLSASNPTLNLKAVWEKEVTEETIAPEIIQEEISKCQTTTCSDPTIEATKDALANNHTVETSLVATVFNPSDSDKQLISDKIQNQLNILIYLDIELVVEDTTANTTLGTISELSSPIRVSVPLSGAYLSLAEGYARTFYIVRIHSGVADIIAAEYNPETGILTFETDRFSTYAVAYTDTKKDDSPSDTDNSSNSGNSSSSTSGTTSLPNAGVPGSSAKTPDTGFLEISPSNARIVSLNLNIVLFCSSSLFIAVYVIRRLSKVVKFHK